MKAFLIIVGIIIIVFVISPPTITPNPKDPREEKLYKTCSKLQQMIHSSTSRTFSVSDCVKDPKMRREHGLY